MDCHGRRTECWVGSVESMGVKVMYALAVQYGDAYIFTERNVAKYSDKLINQCGRPVILQDQL